MSNAHTDSDDRCYVCGNKLGRTDLPKHLRYQCEGER